MTTPSEVYCGICGPGYQFGDEGCRHKPGDQLVQHTPVTAADLEAVEDTAGVSALIIDLMQRNQADLNHTMNSQVSMYRAEAERLAAELEIIRRDIELMLGEPSVPSTWRIAKALWPSQERVKFYQLRQRRDRPIS